MTSFYFAYIGSKRIDWKFFYEYVNIENIETIVEPFCGSSTFSYYCFEKLGYDKKFHLNDRDKNLINFLDTIKKKGGIKYFIDKVNALERPKNKEEYKKNCDNKVYGYYYRNKIYGLRPKAMPTENRNVKVDIKKYEKLDAFYVNDKTILSNKDYIEVFDKYKNDKKAFLFLDPPYLSSFNAFYDLYSEEVDEKKNIIDNTKLFIDIVEYLKICKCRVLLIINKNAITEYLFKDYIRGEYPKTYQLTKKKCFHLIVCNY